MPYVLYSHDGSGGAVVEAALTKAGVDFELVEIHTRKGHHREPDYGVLNPWRQVPALKLPDGTVMTESAAMAIHLAAAHPEAGLGPAPGSTAHAAFTRWLVFMSANVYEADLRYYYPDRYTTDPEGVQAVKQAGRDHMARAFALLEDMLGVTGYLADGRLTLADVYLSMLSIWYPEPLDCPRIKALRAQIDQDADYGPIWERHFGQRWGWEP